MLFADRQSEAFEENQEDKEVVDGERSLQHISGNELERVLVPLRVQQEAGKSSGPAR